MCLNRKNEAGIDTPCKYLRKKFDFGQIFRFFERVFYNRISQVGRMFNKNILPKSSLTRHFLRPLYNRTIENFVKRKNCLTWFSKFSYSRDCRKFQPIRDLESNEEEIKSAKEKRIREIRTYVERTVQKLEKEKRDKLRSLDQQKARLSQETSKIESSLADLEKNLEQLSPEKLMEKTKEMELILNELTNTPMSSFVSSPVSTTYNVNIVPQYVSGPDYNNIEAFKYFPQFNPSVPTVANLANFGLWEAIARDWEIVECRG